MERITIIKNFFDLVGLTKVERISLIKALMDEWGLTVAELTTLSAIPAQNVDAIDDLDLSSSQSSAQETPQPKVITFTEEDSALTDDAQEQTSVAQHQPETQSQPKRRGRRKKTDIADKTPAAPPQTPTKRRGRPKKTATDDIQPPKEEKSPVKRRGRKKKDEIPFTETVESVSKFEAPENEDMLPKNISANDEELIEETAGITDLRTLFDDEPPVLSKTTKRRNQAFRYLADYPALKEQTIGQEYPFEFLYQWENCNLLSPCVLSGLMPVGIYIPYKSIVFGQYRGFIISIYDEKVIDNATEALEDAKTKMQPIDNEEWSVMNAIQFGVVKPSSEILNRMLGKVGGDRLGKTYRLISPKSNHVTGIGNFRYAIDVK